MKTAKIYAVAAGGEHGYAWKWRCDDKITKSPGTFAFYYDCLIDAREHGYSVELTRAQGTTAPSGPSYSLVHMDDRS